MARKKTTPTIDAENDADDSPDESTEAPPPAPVAPSAPPKPDESCLPIHRSRGIQERIVRAHELVAQHEANKVQIDRLTFQNQEIRKQISSATNEIQDFIWDGKPISLS